MNMSRLPIIQAVLAAGLVSAGVAVTARREEDDDPVARAKLKEAQEHYERERLARWEARERAKVEERQWEADRIAMLAAGIDPTNGNPLSRQQRRARARKGLA